MSLVKSSHYVLRISTQKCGKVLQGDICKTLFCLGGSPCDVRSNVAIGSIEQRVIGSRRFGGKHVHPYGGEVPAA